MKIIITATEFIEMMKHGFVEIVSDKTVAKRPAPRNVLPSKRKAMSPAVRKKIAAAQKARWAKIKRAR